MMNRENELVKQSSIFKNVDNSRNESQNSYKQNSENLVQNRN